MSVSGRRVVGRDRELGQIVAFLRGGVVASGTMLIEGEAGVGKTALWEEALDSVGDETTVLSCRSVQTETAYSYIGLSDLLADVIGGVLGKLPGPQRDAIQAALLLRTRAIASPTTALSVRGHCRRSRPSRPTLR